jgi:hypothetical protein
LHEKQRIPSLAEVDRHKRDLIEANNHVFTSEEIDEIIREKQNSVPMPRNLAIEKLNLIAKMEEAETNGDFDAVMEYKSLINQIDMESADPNYLALGNKEPQKKVDIWARLNARNRKLNLQEGREAEKIAREQKLLSQKTGKGLNPFARIKVNPNVDMVEKGDELDTPNSANSSGNISPVEVKPGLLKEVNKGDVLEQALADVEVDIDL